MPLQVLPDPGQSGAQNDSSVISSILLKNLLDKQNIQEQERLREARDIRNIQLKRALDIEQREMQHQKGIESETVKEGLKISGNIISEKLKEDEATTRSANEQLAALDEADAILRDPNNTLTPATIVNIAEGVLGEDSAITKLIKQTPDNEKLQALAKQFVLSAKVPGRLNQELLKLLNKSFPTLNQTEEGRRKIVQALRNIALLKKNEGIASQEALRQYREEQGNPYALPPADEFLRRRAEIENELNAPIKKELFERVSAENASSNIVENLGIDPKSEDAVSINKTISDTQVLFEEAAGYNNPERYENLSASEKELQLQRDRENTVEATHAFAKVFEELAKNDKQFRGDPSAYKQGETLDKEITIDGRTYVFVAQQTDDGYAWVPVDITDEIEEGVQKILSEGEEDATPQ